MKHSKRYLWRKIGFWVFVAVVCLLVWRPVRYAIEAATEPDHSLASYLQDGDHWLADDPYVLFPSLETAQAASEHAYLHEYYHAMMPLLFDDDALTWLDCSYPEELYQEEIKRLQGLCGTPDLEHFQFPAFVWQEGPLSFHGYALCDEAKHEIHYIAAQGYVLLEKYLPKELTKKDLLQSE